MGNWKRGQAGADGPEQLLNYFALPQRIPRACRTLEQRLWYLQEETPLLLSPVTLEDGWSRTMTGPLLVFDGDGQCRLAAPGGAGSYFFWDEGAGKRKRVGIKNERLFQREAYSAALRVPQRRLLSQAVFGGVGSYDWIAGALFTAVSAAGSVLTAFFCSKALAALSAAAEREKLLQWTCLLLLPFIAAVFAWWARERLLLRASAKNLRDTLPAFWEKDRKGAPYALFRELPEDLEQIGQGFRAVLDFGFFLITAASGVILFPGGGFSLAAVLLALLLLSAACCWYCGKGPVKAENGRRLPPWLGGEAFFSEEQKGSALNGTALLLPVVIAAACFCILQGAAAAECSGLFLLSLFTLPKAFQLLWRAPSVGKSAARVKTLAAGLRDRPMLPPLPSREDGSLELREVCFRTPDGTAILDHINMRVQQGEKVGIMGAVGAGKTVLAQVMAGTLPPTSGIVCFGGHDLSRCLPLSAARAVSSSPDAKIILLDGKAALEDLPPNRGAVVFAAREQDLQGCGRLYELRKGRIYERVDN